MKSQEVTTFSASALSGVAGFFSYIEQNATVLNIIISGLGVMFAFIFGVVGCYSVYVTRQKDKKIAEAKVGVAENQAAIKELQKIHSNDKK